ncbi:MAG: TetR/AcrR family transcriptional regulator [Phenylobacterium sp.]|nr:TetR/AcrR family transcriptional regulator [Phenylobacterium sp.]
MPTLEPRKIPRQSRSKVTVQAILDACSENLGARGYHGLTTQGIAARAGVSVGTLYQYFPNRDAVCGALVVRAMERLLEAMRGAFAHCVTQGLESLPATEHLLLTGLDVMVSERTVFSRLGPEAPHLFTLPAVIDIQAQLIHLSQEIRLSSGDQLDLPMPEADAWIIGHMVSASMLQISLLDAQPDQQRILTREVARLTCRMSLANGADPTASAAAA